MTKSIFQKQYHIPRPRSDIKGTLRLAWLHGWSIAIFSGFFCLSSLLGLDIMGLSISGLLMYSGYRESQSYKHTLKHAIQGETLLLVTVILYCAWQIYAFDIAAYLSQPHFASMFQIYSQAEFDELMQSMATYADWFYIAVILCTCVYQAIVLLIYSLGHKRLLRTDEVYAARAKTNDYGYYDNL
jgi:hypothetical protein